MLHERDVVACRADKDSDSEFRSAGRMPRSRPKMYSFRFMSASYADVTSFGVLVMVLITRAL